MNDSNIAKCPRCGAEIPPGVPENLCPRCAAGFLQAAATEVSGMAENGQTFNPPSVAELAPLFPQLEILELLGRGGMGAVYKARQKELDRLVALKILPPGIGQDAAFAQRFAREAKALARLNHPGIVTIYDFGRVHDLYYFLMEFVDGVNLHRLQDNGRISPREALAIVPQICDALQYAHDQGIVHRDIKPQNVLLDRRGRVKVADFGLAKLVGADVESGSTASVAPSESALTEAGKVMGTPAYMAPEQETRPDEVDHRADIYALGVVFYQLLTGELPRKPLEPPSRKVRIDVRLDEVVLKAMDAAPERRYEQASQLKTAVENITFPAGQGTVRPTEDLASGARIQNSVRKLISTQPRWWQVFLAGFLTVVLLEFGAFALTERGLGQLLMALLSGAVAVAVFLIARQVWLNALLVGMLIAFLSWVAVVALGAAAVGSAPAPTFVRAYIICAAAALLGIAVWGMAMKWLRASRVFFNGFIAVFLLVFTASAIVTFLMPESFSSTARIIISHEGRSGSASDPYFIQTEASVVKSGLVLNKVIDNLDLRQKWNQFAKGEPLTAEKAVVLLDHRLEMRSVRNSGLLEIRAFDEHADEAAAIANEVARVFRETRLAQVAENNAAPMRIAIVDMATPGRRPVRPNKPLNLTVGALAGLLLGTIGGAAFEGYRSRKERSSR